jgi:prolyl oligopeptidase
MSSPTAACRKPFIHLLAALAAPLLAACATAPPAASPPATAPAATAPSAPTPPSAVAPEPPDPYLWLEEVDGKRALAWVREQNAATLRRLAANPLYPQMLDQARAVLDSSSRIPAVEQMGPWLYNLWKDADHPRGLYRRTTLAELRGPEPEWQTVLDVDALAAKENQPWVFHGMDCLPPEHRRCLLSLSPGGGDADEVREFDVGTLSFVSGGFVLPVAKHNVGWRDADTLFVATDFGPGTLTESGYPRIVKLWKRGTPLASATAIYEAEATSVSATGFRLRSDAGDVDLVVDGIGFWTQRVFQLVDGRLHRLHLPESARVEDLFRGRLVVSLTEDWENAGRTLPTGAVVVADPAALRVEGGTVEALFAPTETEILDAVTATEQGLMVTLLDAVRGRLYRYQPTAEGWSRQPVPFPDNGALEVMTVDDESGDLFVRFQSFVTPPTLYHVPATTLVPALVKAQEPTFDGSRFEVSQRWTTSADGTRVPYFMVAPKGLPLDGNNPTHIFSYGGFRNALTPSYSGSYEQLYGAYGKLWLERGGVFVLANIRGGGEFGPAWHAAALLHDRHKAYEDFEAVAADLVAAKVTSPERLGIEGRSNGGLLVLATALRHPELYGAVICGSPLADMRRYHRMLAGASWMAEYGDPHDDADWAYLRTYSPYHNVQRGKDYPPIFFYLSTRDDRVHPGHARKMAALLMEAGYEVWYWELVEGGHGASVTNEQLAQRLALAYAHLWTQLGSRPATSGGDG